MSMSEFHSSSPHARLPKACRGKGLGFRVQDRRHTQLRSGACQAAGPNDLTVNHLHAADPTTGQALQQCTGPLHARQARITKLYVIGLQVIGTCTSGRCAARHADATRWNAASRTAASLRSGASARANSSTSWSSARIGVPNPNPAPEPARRLPSATSGGGGGSRCAGASAL